MEEVTTRYLPLSLRAYAEAPAAHRSNASPVRPSHWALVFDCETTTHLDQELRFGFFRIYKADELVQSGAFVAPSLPADECRTVQAYCKKHDLGYYTLAEFVELFYHVGFALHGSIIGFNLPFDLSRLAWRWVPSRRTMIGGWTFFLTEDFGDTPPVQIRSLSHHRALIRFRMTRKGGYTARSMFKRGVRPKPFHGHFVDVHSFANAMLGSSFSLERLSGTLAVEHPKLETDEHGTKLTEAYLAYAERDPLTTWECYLKLRQQLRDSGLTVEPSALYSEAGVAKSILRQMGVKPWREMQPGFDPRLLGIIWSSYYAGRSELHIRRTLTSCTYLDFTSQYPSVAILMQLWRYVIASGVTHCDATELAQTFLESVTLADLFKPETWPKLTMLVQLQPNDDILPARAPYAGQGDQTIGENFVSSEQGIWYTLAAAVASKIRTGRAPKVLAAIQFTPDAMQDELHPIQLYGATVRPTDDVWLRLVERRKELQALGRDHEQLAVKLAANSLAGGIFSEVQASTLPDPVGVTVHANGDTFQVRTHYAEEPGAYYHPLLATFITGAGRLLLAMLEQSAELRGLDWCMCDTDSMVLTGAGMGRGHKDACVADILHDFELLNPYSFGGFLKVEHEHVAFYGISAKRYCLKSTHREGHWRLAKVSGHSLGYLSSPVTPWPMDSELSDAPGWHVEVWRRIIRQFDGAPDYSDLPGFDQTAIMHYSVTRPAIEKWLPLRPFTFVTVMEGVSQFSGVDGWHEIHPIAPYTRLPREAEGLAVDRQTGESLGPDVVLLATYSDALADYHVHPEYKFDPNPHAIGMLPRVHVAPDAFNLIGKEAHLADERAVFGTKDMDAAIEYGSKYGAKFSWKHAFAGHTLAELSRVTGYSKAYLSRLLRDQRDLTDEVRQTFNRALTVLGRS